MQITAERGIFSTMELGSRRNVAYHSLSACELNGSIVLVAVEAALVALDIELALQAEGVSTRSAARSSDALDLLDEERVDFALVDSRLEDGDSFAVRAMLYERKINFCVLANAGGRLTRETYGEAAFIITKPFRLDYFVPRILQYL